MLQQNSQSNDRPGICSVVLTSRQKQHASLKHIVIAYCFQEPYLREILLAVIVTSSEPEQSRRELSTELVPFNSINVIRVRYK